MRTLITTLLTASLFASSAFAAPKAKTDKVDAYEVTPVMFKADKSGFTLNVDMEGEMYTVDLDTNRELGTLSVYDGRDTLVSSIVVSNNKRGNLLLDDSGLIEWSQADISMDLIEKQGWQAQALTDADFLQGLIEEVDPGSDPVAMAWWGWGFLAKCLDWEISHTSNSDGSSSTTYTLGWDCFE